MSVAANRITQWGSLDVLRTIDEQLSVTMGFIKARAKGESGRAIRCVIRYPYLQDSLGYCEGVGATPIDLMAAKNYAVDLARKDVWERVENSKEIRASCPSHEISHRKEKFWSSSSAFSPAPSKDWQ